MAPKPKNLWPSGLSPGRCRLAGGHLVQPLLKYRRLCYCQLMVNVQQFKRVAATIADQFRLDLVVLFGSQAGGITHPGSDVDIGVMSDRRLHPRELAEIGFQLTQILKTPNIEVADLKTLPPLVLKNLAEQSVLLYEREPNLYDRFKIYGLKRHMEAAPLYQARAVELKRFLTRV